MNDRERKVGMERYREREEGRSEREKGRGEDRYIYI